MSTFEINGRRVAYNMPPLVIAEIGINHGGDIKTAFEMVDAAAASGAEIIKHQTHVIDDEMSIEAKSVIPGNADISIYEIMKACALNEEDEFALKAYAESKGLIFISTPFSRAALERLERMEVPAYKVGSGECNNYPLLKEIASKGKPIILSTGMNTIDMIKKSVSILRAAKVPYALLHCTNVYPTPPDLIRLGAITELAETFPDALVGLSDHSLSNLACIGAVALGASILERHFTDSKCRDGVDIECSMDPVELKELIDASKEMARMRGGMKGIVAEEKVTIDFAYASVVCTKAISKGTQLDEKNIWVKRPGNGDFSAEDYSRLIGSIATRDIAAGVQLKKEDILEKEVG